MTSGDAIGLLGVLATLIVGIWAVKRVNKSRRQSQSVSRNSIGIQSGRDTNIEK